MDYNTRVPVDLPADKKTILPYPVAKNIFTNGKPAIPARLSEGFLPVNHGITQNIAFLKLTCLQHNALPANPGADPLFNLIPDDDPLTVLYGCGSTSNYYRNLDGDHGRLLKTKNFAGLIN